MSAALGELEKKIKARIEDARHKQSEWMKLSNGWSAYQTEIDTLEWAFSEIRKIEEAKGNAPNSGKA